MATFSARPRGKLSHHSINDLTANHRHYHRPIFTAFLSEKAAPCSTIRWISSSHITSFGYWGSRNAEFSIISTFFRQITIKRLCPHENGAKVSTAEMGRAGSPVGCQCLEFASRYPLIIMGIHKVFRAGPALPSLYRGYRHRKKAHMVLLVLIILAGSAFHW